MPAAAALPDHVAAGSLAEVDLSEEAALLQPSAAAVARTACALAAVGASAEAACGRGAGISSLREAAAQRWLLMLPPGQSEQLSARPAGSAVPWPLRAAPARMRIAGAVTTWQSTPKDGDRALVEPIGASGLTRRNVDAQSASKQSTPHRPEGASAMGRRCGKIVRDIGVWIRNLIAVKDAA